jgi:sulfide:quinone oxidoreductase
VRIEHKSFDMMHLEAPSVADNLLSMLDGRPMTGVYDGYGACPLTVERGRVVLAEFGYGGKLLPTFPLDR